MVHGARGGSDTLSTREERGFQAAAGRPRPNAQDLPSPQSDEFVGAPDESGAVGYLPLLRLESRVPVFTFDTKISAVTFDAGGTLIAPSPSVGHIYAEVASRYGHRLDPAELNRRFKAAWAARTAFDYSLAAWRSVVGKTVAPFVTVAQLDILFPALYEHFKDPRAWSIFPDVRPTLAHLRGHGLKLGLISNWDERLQPLLERLSLRSSFDVLTISVEIGHTKPASEIFATAAGQLGLEPSEILHVGDSEVEDQQGALAAGFQALLLDRRSSEGRSGTISALAELASLNFSSFLRRKGNSG